MIVDNSNNGIYKVCDNHIGYLNTSKLSGMSIILLKSDKEVSRFDFMRAEKGSKCSPIYHVYSLDGKLLDVTTRYHLGTSFKLISKIRLQSGVKCFNLQSIWKQVSKLTTCFYQNTVKYEE